MLLLYFVFTVLFDDSRGYHPVKTSQALQQVRDGKVKEATIEDKEQRLRLTLTDGTTFEGSNRLITQFPASAKFGADVPRRITTGRGIVVPGTPLPGRTGPAKPQSVTLREFELLYRIIYLPRPAITATDAGGSGGRRPGGAVADVSGRPEVLSDGSPPPTPCREI